MEHYRNKKDSLSSFVKGAMMATVALGYLFFASKNAKRNREMVDGWMENAKAEVMDKMKKVQNLSKQKYYEIVDSVSDKYSALKEVGQEKADEFREELRRKWQEAEEEEEDDEE